MGARVVDRDHVRFRVWAPDARSVEIELYPWPEGARFFPMTRDEHGVWEATVEAQTGWLYRYRLNGEWGYPDPCSRSQPEGVHGPSQIVDPAFAWTDAEWPGPHAEQLAIYEVHVGTYTPEGTFDALSSQLDEIARLGVTAVELMPVAEFPGRWNWGYDGASLYAPSHVYGGPDALRRLVDRAHRLGLAIILDVVYNHFGPEGAYAHLFAKDYFTGRYQTPWGDAINFDGRHSDHVRRYFVDNALYWQHEFHVDGLRLDATHQIYDSGERHFLEELSATAHEEGLPGRRLVVMAEDERNDLRMIYPRGLGGHGLDGLWVDDFHHSVHVLLTREDRGYLGGYEGTAEEIVQLLRTGFLYSSPPKGGGTTHVIEAPVVPAWQLVYCLQNHDQVGNRPYGRRLAHLIDMEAFAAAVALLLLAPATPMIFMGGEFGSSSPFHFFTDYSSELGALVREGRLSEFRDFWASIDPVRYPMPDPQGGATFLRSKLDLTEREKPGHREVHALHRELLWLRRSDPVLSRQDRTKLAAEALNAMALRMERWDDEGNRRLVLVNFGDELLLEPEPTDMAHGWRPLLSTAEERFAGAGVDLASLSLAAGAAVRVPARSTTLWTYP
jgi:maltooligosyltrehalose trehalohydrolase